MKLILSTKADMQKYLSNQIHEYKHTQPAGKHAYFLHICREIITYYNQGMITKNDLTRIIEEFIQFKELLQDKYTRHIIGMAALLEVPENSNPKSHSQIINEMQEMISLAI